MKMVRSFSFFASGQRKKSNFFFFINYYLDHSSFYQKVNKTSDVQYWVIINIEYLVIVQFQISTDSEICVCRTNP